ncbi:RNA polymerase sigma factor [Paenibacillus rhizovicinus]|uniref:RNA polymerase sigma factor n=1 Tax=Paenibacillus rhizovicinus TaxID=2704463 RepID=A0A6C0P7W4_9BACL|nr:RNA polymerase sigma factor [Paenibacillus rhizovicinus]QHW33723.1 RNA polymerase sigma factor [Paenibacillus rhizovicinus]
MEEDYLKHLSQIGAYDIEQLVHQYWQDVWHFSYVMTRQHDMADDIAQETFIRAFRALHTFRGESSVKTWLLKIAKHLTINYRRSALFRKIILLDQAGRHRSSPSAEAAYFDAQFADRIWELVLRLPVKQREVLLLHAHYQLKLEEMARVLGLPEGTVKSRLHRARLKVDKWLKEADASESE